MGYDFLAYDKKKKEHKPKGSFGGLLGEVVQKDEEDKREDRKETESLIGALDRAEKIEKEIGGEIIEKGPNYKIVKTKDDKTPTYVVAMPKLDEKDKADLQKIKRTAIGEITIDPESIHDRDKRWKTFKKEVLQLMEMKFPEVPPAKQDAFAELIVQDMIGYGLLEPLLADDALEEVMVVGTHKAVYVYHRKHGMCKTNITFETNEESENIIARIARSIGRRVDMSSPLLDARLPDGSRVNATVPPVSLDGSSLTIRKFKADPLTVIDIINFHTLTVECAAFLWLVAEGYGVKPANFLVSGGTGSGKTTTLNCLGSFVPLTDRIITIEDTAELQLPVEHWVRLETRPPNVEGRGEVSMDMLLKNTLRMRPDRIIVGEVRGAEAGTLLAAMNTGQNGCLGTLHANTAKETITRLTSAPMSVPMVMIPSLNLILMQNRFQYRGKTVRRITEIAEITGLERGKVQMNIIYEWDPKDDKIKSTGVPSTFKRKLADLRGVTSETLEKELKQREEVLQYMIDTNVSGVQNVGKVINDYYIDPDGLMAKIHKKEGMEEKAPLQREILEEGSGYKIVRVPEEKNPQYIVSIPKVTKTEREAMEEIEKRAISDIKIDPTTIEDKGEARKMFKERIMDTMARFHPEISIAKRGDFADIIVENMIGYGLLEYLLNDDNLEEIMVVGTGKDVYVGHREYGVCRTNIRFETDDESLRIIEKIASSVGRRIDKSTPLLDARLKDGSRVNATIPPISVLGPTLTIRKFREDPLTVVDLINYNTLTPEVSAYLWVIVEGLGIKPGNILAAGGSGCGKTTTLNVLCSFTPSTERVITIEDTAELHLPIEHTVRLETRPPNVEGEGEVSMDDLVKNTLRMRPDRVIVGEVRGPEARTLFTAMNTGHDGCMGTVHSNSARETIVRLTNPPMRVPEIMIPALDLILMQSKIFHKGKTIRRITEIAEISGSEKEKLTLNNVYEWDPKSDSLKPTGVPSLLKQRMARLKGISVDELQEEIDKREKVIRWMVKKNKRSITEVSQIFERYYNDPDTVLQKIEETG
jgi:flagellar protein FlaI